MALGSQLPIRLDSDTDARLQAAAERAGTSKSALIRMLAKTFVDQCVTASGQVTLPPNWADLLPQKDNRSSSYENRSGVQQIGNNNKQTTNVFSPAPLPPGERVRGKGVRPKGAKKKKKG